MWFEIKQTSLKLNGIISTPAMPWNYSVLSFVLPLFNIPLTFAQEQTFSEVTQNTKIPLPLSKQPVKPTNKQHTPHCDEIQCYVVIKPHLLTTRTESQHGREGQREPNILCLQLSTCFNNLTVFFHALHLCFMFLLHCIITRSHSRNVWNIPMIVWQWCGLWLKGQWQGGWWSRWRCGSSEVSFPF